MNRSNRIAPEVDFDHSSSPGGINNEPGIIEDLMQNNSENNKSTATTSKIMLTKLPSSEKLSGKLPDLPTICVANVPQESTAKESDTNPIHTASMGIPIPISSEIEEIAGNRRADKEGSHTAIGFGSLSQSSSLNHTTGSFKATGSLKVSSLKVRSLDEKYVRLDASDAEASNSSIVGDFSDGPLTHRPNDLPNDLNHTTVPVDTHTIYQSIHNNSDKIIHSIRNGNKLMDGGNDVEPKREVLKTDSINNVFNGGPPPGGVNGGVVINSGSMKKMMNNKMMNRLSLISHPGSNAFIFVLLLIYAICTITEWIIWNHYHKRDLNNQAASAEIAATGLVDSNKTTTPEPNNPGYHRTSDSDVSTLNFLGTLQHMVLTALVVEMAIRTCFCSSVWLQIYKITRRSLGIGKNKSLLKEGIKDGSNYVVTKSLAKLQRSKSKESNDSNKSGQNSRRNSQKSSGINWTDDKKSFSNASSPQKLHQSLRLQDSLYHNNQPGVIASPTKFNSPQKVTHKVTNDLSNREQSVQKQSNNNNEKMSDNLYSSQNKHLASQGDPLNDSAAEKDGNSSKKSTVQKSKSIGISDATLRKYKILRKAEEEKRRRMQQSFAGKEQFSLLDEPVRDERVRDEIVKDCDDLVRVEAQKRRPSQGYLRRMSTHSMSFVGGQDYNDLISEESFVDPDTSIVTQFVNKLFQTRLELAWNWARSGVRQKTNSIRDTNITILFVDVLLTFTLSMLLWWIPLSRENQYERYGDTYYEVWGYGAAGGRTSETPASTPSILAIQLLLICARMGRPLANVVGLESINAQNNVSIDPYPTKASGRSASKGSHGSNACSSGSKKESRITMRFGNTSSGNPAFSTKPRVTGPNFILSELTTSQVTEENFAPYDNVMQVDSSPESRKSGSRKSGSTRKHSSVGKNSPGVRNSSPSGGKSSSPNSKNPHIFMPSKSGRGETTSSEVVTEMTEQSGTVIEVL